MNRNEEKILHALELDPTMAQKHLAHYLERSQARTSIILDKMVQKGLIERTFRDINGQHFAIKNAIKNGEESIKNAIKNSYSMTSIPRLGSEESKPSSSFKQETELKPEAANPIERLHRLERKHRILGQQSSLLNQQQEEVRLNNNSQEFFQVDGITCCRTTRNLIVMGIRLSSPLSTPSPELLKAAELKADKIALRAAARKGLDIAKEGITSIYEIEITPFEPTAQVMEKGIITLYEDHEHGKIWMDKSLNMDAIESNRTKYVERIREFAVDIGKYDGWRETKENIRELSSLVYELATDLKLMKERGRL